MAQSLSKIWTHLIFSTKDRYPFLRSQEIRQQTHSFIAAILRENNCPTLLVGGIADHVHALFALSKNHSVAQIVYQCKRGSSKWIKTKGSLYRNFHWQSGYGAFSVSRSHVEQVRKYILDQEIHHHKVTFQEELLSFLKKYQMEYDERYLWE